MNTKIDTMNEVCNTLGDRTPGVDGTRRTRKRMKQKRLRQRQVQKEKKRAERQQRLRTPRQRMPVKTSAQLSFQEVKSDRVQIQFRIGSAIVDKIDRAAQAESKDKEKPVSRNNWLISAVQEFLKNPKPGSFDAVEISANRVPILFRVGSLVRTEIDRTVAAMNIDNRTTWILAAILSKLENYDFS